MFQSLIRRSAARPLGKDDEAFESTSFSLTTAVPRPVERRDDDRVHSMLQVAKVLSLDGQEQMVRVRNMSAGGLMAETGIELDIGEAVSIELSSQKIPSTVVWRRDGVTGFKFDQNLDLGELLAGRKTTRW